MDLGDPNPNSNRCRLIGDYIIGPKIGSGSFAVVWRARHRRLGLEVAIKEIDKKHLSHKIKDNLLKEIEILNNITHPNIMRFHEAIQTEDKIYLVLEYCNGGDLSTYIHRHGRISETLANNFMTQLASGLQVLRQNNLIHRDLKPQNLLLSITNDTQVLKIGDFGFARYLTPQGLADTLCGSPLYMAPEIIQNKKYDAKADLWSVGAILFQLVTGKPPFEGNSQFQLFQNILTSNELRFPEGVLEQLHPDCVDLCRSLLRLNPVERLTFEEFFNHNFLRKPRPMMMDLGQSSLLPENKPMVEQLECYTDDKLPFASDKEPQPHSECLINSSNTIPNKVLPIKEQYSRTLSSDVMESGCEFMLNIANDRQRKSVDAGPSNSSDIWSTKTESVERQLFNTSGTKVGDSLEFVEQEYVLVNSHFGSLETLSSSLEASMQESSATRLSKRSPTKTGKGIVVAMQTGEQAGSYVCGVESLGSHVSAPSQALIELGDACGPSPLHPLTRLRLLNQYAHALSELAQEKLNAGLHVESFSVELVVLAVWTEALRVCRSWETSCSHNECKLDVGSTNLPQNLKESLDFGRPASISSFVEHEFIMAVDRAEKISNYFQNMDGGAEMPDAMEIIFQTAIGAGRSGAADELIGNTPSAEASYAKARILFSFIVGEATSLPLNPPFSLTDFDQKRIQKYIINLKVHQAHSQRPPSPDQNLGFPRK